MTLSFRPARYAAWAVARARDAESLLRSRMSQSAAHLPHLDDWGVPRHQWLVESKARAVRAAESADVHWVEAVAYILCWAAEEETPGGDKI